MQDDRERQFEIEIKRAKGLEIRRMVGDGNCLFRAVSDQVYGDAEMHSDTRQMCIDYMVCMFLNFEVIVLSLLITVCC
jgi:OTU domain-containing protein 5